MGRVPVFLQAVPRTAGRVSDFYGLRREQRGGFRYFYRLRRKQRDRLCIIGFYAASIKGFRPPFLKGGG
ncbi:hypothetical protein D3Z39_13535 [Anaerotruncus colihominis]|uniref:Uncharacterized protein n=1 Tax=Anaerotruncus colihominis TaxID=169435 RepID=A0A845RM73_9FIRM|nr:hypothetical protein [Anaerotruncus colihominis]